MKKANIFPDSLMVKFLAGRRLSNDEIILLDKLFNDENYTSEISSWLKNNWQQSEPEAVALKFEEIKKKLGNTSVKYKTNYFLRFLTKAAAILFIPLLGTAFYLYINQFNSHELLTLVTKKGEQTSVILPDGSEAWLNVETKLTYPVDYGVKNRTLILQGEAYFEVRKNTKLPFRVTSGNIVTEALGTKFVVNAYDEMPEIKTSLLEGAVKITGTDGTYYGILKPGQQLKLDKKHSHAAIRLFNSDYELGWKDNELIFCLTPFDEVITTLEKWYNIHIEYDPEQFKAETLTVRFEEYESFENVLKVISKANGFKYLIENKYIKITR